MSQYLGKAVSYIPTKVSLGAVSEGVKAVHTGSGNFLAGVFDLITADPENDAIDNPFFTQNGHEGPSPRTADYFTAMKPLVIGATMGVSMMDVVGITSLMQTGAKGLVWYKLNALFEKLVPPSRRAKPVVYAGWFSYEVAKKAVPAGSLEARLTAIIRQKMYATGMSALTATTKLTTEGLAGFFVDSAIAWAGPTLDSWFGQDTMALAQGLHWFAFLETVVGRGQGKGPALRILEVIWQEFALGSVALPKLEDIVREPRGWLVIAERLK